MSNFQLRFQSIIGVDADGDPIGSEPKVLAETNDTNTKELKRIMEGTIDGLDTEEISRDSYVIWTTATPPERKG